MIKKYFLFIIIFSILSLSPVYAGVVVGGTRIIYNGDKREVSLSVRNPDNITWLIQSWADNKGATGSDKETIPAPFTVTPPLFRLDKGKENLIRIIYNGKTALPEDRESVFWMNVKSIPAIDNDSQNVLQLSVKTRIKILYRPPGLSVNDASLWQNVTFKRTGTTLLVTNPTPFYISFYKLMIGQKTVDTTDIMVPPLSTATYSLPSGINSEQITWQYINDYGGNSPFLTTRLQ